MTAAPAATTWWRPSRYPDLVNWSGSGATDLSSDSGLITTYEYGSATTATSSSPGNVVNYLEETAIQQGTGGTSVPQESDTYLANTAGGVTVYNAAGQLVLEASPSLADSFSHCSSTAARPAYTWATSPLVAVVPMSPLRGVHLPDTPPPTNLILPEYRSRV
jgi:hypothetical protein